MALPSTQAELGAFVQQQVQLQLQTMAGSVSPGGAGGTAHPPSRPERPRLPPPPFYAGGAAALDDWFSAMEQQITWYGIGLPDDQARLVWIAAYLQGPALEWWKTLPAKPATVAGFAAALRARFQPVNSAETTRGMLLSLVQGKGGVQAYVDAFRRLLVRVPDMAESDRVFQFLRGLHPDVATQLRIQGVATMDKAVEMAVRIGSVMELGRASNGARPAAAAAQAGSTSMELDNIEGLEKETGASPKDDEASKPVTQAQLRELLNAMRESRGGRGGRRGGRTGMQSHRMRGLPQVPHLTPVQVQEYMDAGKCFACGKTGHDSRNCPHSKNAKEGQSN